MLNRDKGIPSLWGSSHAMAFTSIATLGGKASRPPASRPILQAAESLGICLKTLYNRLNQASPLHKTA